MKTETIRNTRGELLYLTSRRLTQGDNPEMPCCYQGTRPRYIKLSELAKALRKGTVPVYRVSDDDRIYVDCNLEDRILGCCTFDTETFARILKAAKLTKSGKKKRTK